VEAQAHTAALAVCHNPVPADLQPVADLHRDLARPMQA
jgi:hypothetical protein